MKPRIRNMPPDIGQRVKNPSPSPQTAAAGARSDDRVRLDYHETGRKGIFRSSQEPETEANRGRLAKVEQRGKIGTLREMLIQMEQELKRIEQNQFSGDE